MTRYKSTTLGLCLLFGMAGIAQARAQDIAHPQGKPAEDTVTVTAKKEAVKRKADGTVYDESMNPQAQSGTAADVLNTVPAVHVSPDGKVTLRGDSNVQIYINGRPAAEMKGESRAVTLQSMSGGDIASVEVITNPSAKYDANGGGIINIVLKKNRKPGANGVLNANLGNDRRFNVTVSGNSTRGRLSLHGRVGFRHDVARMRRRSDLTWTDPSSLAAGRSAQHLDVDALRASRSANAGLDYTLSDADRVSLEATYARRHSSNRNDEYHQDYSADGTLVRDFDRQSLGPRGQTDKGLTFTFNHTGKAGDEFKLSLAHSLSDSFQDKSYSNIYPAQALPKDRVRALSTTGRRLSEISADYVRPIGDSAQLSAGFDLQSERDSFYNYKATIDPATNLETVDARRTNAFAVDQTLKAAYLTYQTPIGRWTVLAGARLESVTLRAQHAKGFTHMNPSLHATYAIDGKRQWKISYRQSLQRPAPRDLNPFLLYVDAQNVTAGNPDLKPQHVSALEAEYTFTDDAFSDSITAYYRTSTHTVTDFSYFIDDQVLLTTKRNAGSGLSGGIDYTASGKISKALSYSLDGNLFYAELQSADLGGPLKSSGVSWTAQATLDYEPNDADSFEISLNAQGKSLTSQGTRSGTSAVNLSWRHRLTPKLRLVLTANDIGNGGRQILETTTSTVHQVAMSHDLGPVVFVGLSWTLGK